MFLFMYFFIFSVVFDDLEPTLLERRRRGPRDELPLIAAVAAAVPDPVPAEPVPEPVHNPLFPAPARPTASKKAKTSPPTTTVPRKKKATPMTDDSDASSNASGKSF
jgi:hypothetical protein